MGILIFIGATAIAFIYFRYYRTRLWQAERPPGAVQRLALSVLFLAATLAVAIVAGVWLAVVVLIGAGASLAVSRLLFPDVPRWHWPTVTVALVGVPAVAFVCWAAFAAN